MNKKLYPSEDRGTADYGWLKPKYSFSFAHYYDQEKMNFGMLRVLNDDIIDADRGFDTHRHEDMEIVTIPLEGELTHKDSKGNEETIRMNEIQVMSAGTGIYHSEYNLSKTEKINLLQIWVLPREKGVEPRYDQKLFDPSNWDNKFYTVVGPDKNGENLWVNQDVYFSFVEISKGNKLNYDLQRSENGLYIFVIHGTILVESETLNKRDAIGLTDLKNIEIESSEDSKLLLIDVPMQ